MEQNMRYYEGYEFYDPLCMTEFIIEFIDNALDNEELRALAVDVEANN